MLTFRVYGEPGPQGSKSAKGSYVGADGQRHVRMVESSKKVKPWRDSVAVAVSEQMDKVAGWEPLDGALRLHVRFTFARPLSHYGTGRNAGTLKASAPHWHTQYPDASKVVRATEDALKTAGAIRDDSRICVLQVEKVWGTWSGADVTVTSEGVAGA